MKTNLLERKRVTIAGFGAHLLDPERCLVAYTTNGGVLVMKNHPEYKNWYCTQDGRFFHLTKGGSCLREVKVHWSPGMRTSRANMHGAYPQLRLAGYKLCHHFMWEVWKGARRGGMEIDHVNGNKLDWRLCNLEEVTPAENRKRAQILREMRRNGIEPSERTSDELRAIFNKIRVLTDKEKEAL